MPAIVENKLSTDFYLRNVTTVAKDLLGKIIVHVHNDNILSAKIVEVEAYQGETDEASHSYGGISERNKVMFDTGGKLYVYLIYGIYFCANVVTGNAGQGDAVLIRAVEPIDGIDLMFNNRKRKTRKNNLSKQKLTNGPAKFCEAFNIGKEHNGLSLNGNKVFLLNNKTIEDKKIKTTTRIGISKSKELKWRFYIKDNIFVSHK